MTRLLLYFFLLLPALGSTQSLFIRNVTVVDVIRGVNRPGQSVLVREGVIRAIGPRLRVPAGIPVVDGAGRYLAPGYTDFNASVLNYEAQGEPALLLLLANGVTSVRDLQPNVPAGFGARLRGELAAGRPGPRLYLVSPLITTRGRRDAKVVVTTPAEGRAAVDAAVADGADVIKVDYTLAPDVLAAVTQQAQQHRRRVVGGFTTPFDSAALAGVDAIDHASDLRRTNTVGRARYFAFYRADSSRVVPRVEFYNRLLPSLGPLDTFCFRRTIATLRREDCWLVLNHASYMPSVARFEAGDTTRARYRPARRAAALQKALADNEQIATLARYKNTVEIDEIRWAQELGLGLLYGTQTADYLTPGFTLHDGFYWMQAAGFRPIDILRSASINPARFLGKTRSAGSVDTGKAADLVLLDADPLADIGNARRIRAVIVGGVLYDRARLDELLAEAARRAR
ncbi:amidohydrolase family protein [Flaviaesturariibacter amylovorans]|uniref:Amidohydrolase family protein n=1 Tax=Flaviaesturariibacter amylovorans TaxID=1084520 RepID=A0ABP8HIG0_9BACT